MTRRNLTPLPFLLLVAGSSCSSGEDSSGSNVYDPLAASTGNLGAGTGGASATSGGASAGVGGMVTNAQGAGSQTSGGSATMQESGASGGGATVNPMTTMAVPEPPPPPVCGDGQVDGTEQCDDGNMVGGDGCEADCTVTPAAECGNGVLDDGEECDDGNMVGGDGCEANCFMTPPDPMCGDGNTDVDIGELCDDGNLEDGDGCESDCTPTPRCGDGNLDEGEACDDGNTMPGDGCEADCTATPVDMTAFAEELNGHTIIMPCGQFTSTEVCTPVSNGMSFPGDPGLQGQISHYAEVTFGGDPGTIYNVTVYVRGLVESKVYNNGMDVDSSGNQVPANGLYIGGTPDNSTNGYNVYRLKTESPAQDYFLNSVGVPGNNRMFHGVFDTEFEFTFPVEGGSTIILSSADPNNSAIANCGTEQDNQCAGTEVVLQNLDPLIADDVTQPFNGQFIGFIVRDVSLAE